MKRDVAGVGLHGFPVPVEGSLEVANEPEDTADEVARGRVASLRQCRILEARVCTSQPALRRIQPCQVCPGCGVAIIEPDRGLERLDGRCPIRAVQRDAGRQEVRSRHIWRRRQYLAADRAGKLPVTGRQGIKAGLEPALKCSALGH